MANSWIKLFDKWKLIMNLQLVYRYYLSLSKNENMFKTTNQTKKTKQKKRKKKKQQQQQNKERKKQFPLVGIEPQTIDV